jgi:putative acetyltransferase
MRILARPVESDILRRTRFFVDIRMAIIASARQSGRPWQTLVIGRLTTGRRRPALWSTLVSVMKIRSSVPVDHDALVDIWLRSVRATHDFLTRQDIEHLHQLVKNGALNGLEIWVLCDETDKAVGFMGLSDAKVEALFLAPEVHRRGYGRQLLTHARELKGNLTVDVNEQNPAAVQFYEACGFVVEGRSPLDGSGLPFPILHMRQSGENRAKRQVT